MEISSNIEFFNWASIKMEATLAVCAILTLLATACLPKSFNKIISVFAFVGMYVALGINFVFPIENGHLGILPQNNVLGCLIVMCAILSAQMSFYFFDKLGRTEYRNEFIALIMISAASLIIFGRSSNLMLAFVALECATICLYILACFNKDSSASLEASTKYLIVGGVSGATLLLGIAFIYGASRISGIDFLYFDNFSEGLLNKFFLVGFILILAGIFFKIAVFPFQFWAPDVYQGSPTPVSAFFAVASKIAGVVFLARICIWFKFDSVELLGAKEHILTAISAVAIITILIGNLGGITQQKTKRLMAFSGISNAGYLLVLIASLLAQPKILDSFGPVMFFYLGAYMFANYALFFAINQFADADDSLQSLQDYRGLMRKRPTVASGMIVSLASLAGIPPTAGFFGKVLILILAWWAQLYWLIAVMILGSAISIYYYFGWIRAMLEKSEGSEASFEPTPSSVQTIVLLSIAVIVLSVVVLPILGV
ncbi:MAG: NADH-quinone oxidoreductase subunit N [Verrucomicrobiaceae bacterium]|nr:NADH-quinone oxidoreductase subunit N [Verrucomicrobiaceae bacterium]